MPELPEVEVVKIFLEKKLTGRKLLSLEVLNPKSFIGDLNRVTGTTITSFSRIGKQLSIHLNTGDILLVHLKMSGQLIYVGDSRTVLGHPTPDSISSSLPNKSTRLIFNFDDSSRLYFNDQRKFGWVQLFDVDRLKIFQSPLGLDIFDKGFTPPYLHSQLQRSCRAVKVVLLDQHYAAGIGNIYANDALFLSNIHPSTPASKITLNQSKLIRRHLIDIMQQSVLAGGSTAKDNKYLRPDGTYGGNQFYFRVYQRQGEPCLKCQTPIVRYVLGGRGTFYCPKCQVL